MNPDNFVNSPPCSYSVQHSSPIPILEVTPSQTTDTQIDTNPNEDTIQSAGIETNTRSPAVPPPTTTAPTTTTTSNCANSLPMQRLKMYRHHSFQRMTSIQWWTVISAWTMIISFFLFPFLSFPDRSYEIQTETQIMWIMAKIAYPVLFAIGFILYVFLSAMDCGIRPKETCTASTASIPNTANSDTTFWCYLCEEVRTKGTKHCYSCKKCVIGFDHHCPFLNTCIGSKNYPLFIAICCVMEMICCLHLAVASYVWWNLDRLGFGVSFMSRETLKICLLLSMVIPIVFGLSMLSLLNFHSYLTWKGLTTFEWIVKKRRKEAQKRLNRLKAQRELTESRKASIGLNPVTSNSTAP